MNTLVKIVATGILAASACVAGAQGNSAASPGQQSGPGQSAKNTAPGQADAAKGSGNAQGKQKTHATTKGNGGNGRNPSGGNKQGKSQSGSSTK